MKKHSRTTTLRFGTALCAALSLYCMPSCSAEAGPEVSYGMEGARSMAEGPEAAAMAASSCEAATCDGAVVHGLTIPACCTPAGACGLDLGVGRGVIPNLPGGCVEVGQPGEEDARCPTRTFDGRVVSLEMAGCCRPNGLCGVVADVSDDVSFGCMAPEAWSLPAAVRCDGTGCTDGLRNGSESDIDCGAECAGCGAAQGCNEGADCESGVCSAGACQSPTCSDGVKNANETDPDCGGACSACAIGESCITSADCEEGAACSGDSRCHPSSCHDGVQDGAELAVDCGGSACAPCRPCYEPGGLCAP